MSDRPIDQMDAFGAQLGRDLRSLSDRSLRSVDPTQLARELAAVGARPRFRLVPGLARDGHPRPRTRLAAGLAAAAVIVAIVGAGLRLAASHEVGASPSPIPSGSPSPRLTTGAFFAAGSMATGRYGHTATLLADGRVLVAGGTDVVGGLDSGRPTAKGPMASAELYDPIAGTFRTTGSMSAPRVGHTATLLSDGRVLVTGGQNWSRFATPLGVTLASSELFDPTSGTFTATGLMTTPRTGAAATRLADGRVLIAGGLGDDGVGLTAAELYDPATGKFTATGSMPSGTGWGEVAMLLADDRVLLVHRDTSAVETYDPVTRTFGSSATVSVPYLETANVIADGRVLFIGGDLPNLSEREILNVVAELYDPASGSLGPTLAPAIDFQAMSATLRLDGRVLLVGFTGRADAVPDLPAAALLFDPTNAAFYPVSAPPQRIGGSATLLLDGSVLFAGGSGTNGGGSPADTTAELFK